MKRLSSLIALTAMLVGTSANAAELVGTVLLEDNTGPGQHFSNMPSGANEIGRFGRYMVDHRLTDMTFTNRDFQAWKPLTPYASTFAASRVRGVGAKHHPTARRVATRVYIPVVYY